MDIQRFERDSTRIGITHNWTGDYYTIGTSGQIQIKSKLCYNSQIKYKHVVNNYIYSICKRGYMVVTHSSSTQEKWQTKNMYKFQKIKCNHKEGSIPITFHRWSFEHNSKVWGIFFLKWIFKISSNLYNFRGRIENSICYRLGGFYKKVMPFGVKNGRLTY